MRIISHHATCIADTCFLWAQVVRIHTHIGSGSDPAVWQRVSGLSIDLCRKFPDVTTLNMGGGYKVGRMAYEKARA